MAYRIQGYSSYGRSHCGVCWCGIGQNVNRPVVLNTKMNETVNEELTLKEFVRHRVRSNKQKSREAMNLQVDILRLQEDRDVEF